MYTVEQNKHNYSIRNAIFEDYQNIANLYEYHLKYHPEIYKRYKYDQSFKEYLKSVLCDNKNKFLIAELNKSVIGFIYSYKVVVEKIPIYFIRRYALIDILIVKEEFQNRGVAKALIKEINTWAKEEQLEHIEFDESCLNKHAINLYQKIGYEKLRSRMRKCL